MRTGGATCSLLGESGSFVPCSKFGPFQKGRVEIGMCIRKKRLGRRDWDLTSHRGAALRRCTLRLRCGAAP